jgi:hypothetical protein
MNMPGFTAEQGLEQDQGRYLQCSTGRPVERAGDVRPQLPRDVCDSLWELCIFYGNQGACWLAERYCD